MCRYSNHTYHAIQGGGAFLNGEPIHVSERHLLKDSLLATGFFPHLDLEEQIRLFTELVREARGVRRPGAAAYDLCLVAQGVFDGFWEKNLKPWDAAAGVLLVREAGGKVWNYEGKDYQVGHDSLIASNPPLLSELYRRMQTGSNSQNLTLDPSKSSRSLRSEMRIPATFAAFQINGWPRSRLFCVFQFKVELAPRLLHSK